MPSAGFGISRATAYRYHDEAVRVLASRPGPDQIDLWYSGKAHEHGGNVQALSAPDNSPLWVNDVALGSMHDLTAAREQMLGAPLLGRRPPRPTDPGQPQHPSARKGQRTQMRRQMGLAAPRSAAGRCVGNRSHAQ